MLWVIGHLVMLQLVHPHFQVPLRLWQMVRIVQLVPLRLFRVQQARGQMLSPEPVQRAELDTQLTMRVTVLVSAHRWHVFVN